MPAKKLSSLGLLVIACAMTSACGQPEPLRIASDGCLTFKRISAEPAPAAGMDDPGNVFDTDQTFGEVLSHNAAYDALCPVGRVE